jgi:putative tryptophan/tyrosine transport system substrate-binding protein
MQFDHLKRREFMTLLAGVTAWPLAARAQQPAMPTVGYLSPSEPERSSNLVAAFAKGLSEAGFAEGRTVALEYRWARFDADRLPGLAADLVRSHVALTAALAGDDVARAAKAATTTIPVVFAVGSDPVQTRLVGAVNQPGGNVTGITTMNVDIGPKWLGLMHDLKPAAKRFAVLVNNEINRLAAHSMITGVQAAALSRGQQIVTLFASTEGEIDAAIAGCVQMQADALLIQPDGLFLQRREQLAVPTLRYRLPAIYAIRDFPYAGGLMSYGSSYEDAHRLAGVYAGRILKGENPAQMPVIRGTKFDFVINVKTAKALGIEVPPTLLAIADEVIE